MEVLAGTVLKDLDLLSAVINIGTTEWGLENVLRLVSLIPHLDQETGGWRKVIWISFLSLHQY